jgi:hypothetical protein
VAEAFSNPLQSPQPVAAGRQGAEATLGPYMTGTERSAARRPIRWAQPEAGGLGDGISAGAGPLSIQ